MAHSLSLSHYLALPLYLIFCVTSHHHYPLSLYLSRSFSLTLSAAEFALSSSSKNHSYSLPAFIKHTLPLSLSLSHKHKHTNTHTDKQTHRQTNTLLHMSGHNSSSCRTCALNLISETQNFLQRIIFCFISVSLSFFVSSFLNLWISHLEAWLVQFLCQAHSSAAFIQISSFLLTNGIHLFVEQSLFLFAAISFLVSLCVSMVAYDVLLLTVCLSHIFDLNGFIFAISLSLPSLSFTFHLPLLLLFLCLSLFPHLLLLFLFFSLSFNFFVSFSPSLSLFHLHLLLSL